MSGFEIAGIVLGGIPLVISGLEHWREVAKISGYYRRIRWEHQKCVDEIWYNGILYKRNLKELLHPIVDDSDDVDRLLKDPGSVEWKSKALADRLEDRLQESYASYMAIMMDMEETIEELKKVLFLDKDTIQSQLSTTQINETLQGSAFSSMRIKMDYQLFRIKFSFGEDKRRELFQRLKTNNERLEKLLSTSDRISTLQDAQPTSAKAKPTSALEAVFAKARKKSELLFKAISEAWQCSCQEHHFANLRLEHRTIPEFCFEVILMFTASASPSEAHWSWTKLQCGQMSSCIMGKKQLLTPPAQSAPQSKAHYNGPYQASLPIRFRKKKQVAFHDSTLVPSIELNGPAASGIKLCQTLGTHGSHECMGVIGTDSEIYHLHPFDKPRQPLDDGPCTLDHILSDKFVGSISRRQRYSIALVVASSVAQLQYTTWLTTGLTKKDILFYPCKHDICKIPFHEPFIRQGFASQSGSPDSQAADCNFYSLGILLLELCFGQRLEDYPPRQAYPSAPIDIKQACDTMAALGWSRSVEDESGADYASAVKWCFTGAKSAGQSWKSDILSKVIRPLESCQEQFKTVAEH